VGAGVVNLDAESSPDSPILLVTVPRPYELDHPQELAAMYVGRSIADIGDLLGVSATTVQRALARHGIVRRGRGDAARTRITNPYLADRHWLANRYRSASIQAICAELGVDRATVRRALVIHAIDLHSQRLVPRADRPALLDDAKWLADRYDRAWTIREIAHELGVNQQMVGSALRRHGIVVRSHRGSEHPQLVDAAWLAARVDELGTDGVAAELGVSRVGVQAALHRHGLDSPHRFDGGYLERPSPSSLLAAWEREETIKGVARAFEVSHTTAAIWLATVGVFIKESPVISSRDLESCITEGLTIAEICARYHVTGRTVIVELHRHGLLDRHRRRHLAHVE
jgi:transposase